MTLPPPSSTDVRDNAIAQRFELDIGGATAFANYRIVSDRVIITHTETPTAPGGLVLDFPGVQRDAIADVDGVRLPTDHGRLTLRQPAHHIHLASD